MIIYDDVLLMILVIVLSIVIQFKIWVVDAGDCLCIRLFDCTIGINMGSYIHVLVMGSYILCSA